MCVQGGEGSVEHAAPHLSVAVVQSVGDKKEEERGDLGLLQVLRQLIQSQSNAASGRVGNSSILVQSFCVCKTDLLKPQDLPGLPLVRWGFRNYSAQGIQHRRWSLQQENRSHFSFPGSRLPPVIWSACGSHIELLVVELSELAENRGRLLSVIGHNS